MKFKIKDKDLFELSYFQITDLWQRFCEEHRFLYELTCDEYTCLLKSNIDQLDEVVQKKKIIMETIDDLDELRSELINKINDNIEDLEISSVSDLLTIMNIYELEHERKHLFSFNSFLIEIITQIQEQNKANQMFINKALTSLDEIKREVLGNGKKYNTYDFRGSTSSSRS